MARRQLVLFRVVEQSLILFEIHDVAVQQSNLFLLIVDHSAIGIPIRLTRHNRFTRIGVNLRFTCFRIYNGEKWVFCPIGIHAGENLCKDDLGIAFPFRQLRNRNILSSVRFLIIVGLTEEDPSEGFNCNRSKSVVRIKPWTV